MAARHPTPRLDGLRRGDAVRIGKQHVRDGIATIKTEKSGETVEVTIPILDVLQQTLNAGPTGDLAWICGERGQPLSKETFRNEFSVAARAAGVKKSAHGVRKVAATTAANAGATVHELEAIFGWNGGSMASLYTRKADRARLSKQAIQKLARGTDAAHSFPHLGGRCGSQREKRNEINAIFRRWCGRGDSNPHPFREQIFVPLRLSPPP
jgi:integrase